MHKNPRTINYYGEMLEKAKKADSITVSKLTTFDKLMVLMIRHRLLREEIYSFDGKDFFIYSIRNGMVGKNTVANNSIGDIIVDENFAKAKFVRDGEKAPFYIHFYKEDNKWKIDLTSMFPMVNMGFKNMINDLEISETEFLMRVLEMASGVRPSNEIWSPHFN